MRMPYRVDGSGPANSSRAGASTARGLIVCGQPKEAAGEPEPTPGLPVPSAPEPAPGLPSEPEPAPGVIVSRGLGPLRSRGRRRERLTATVMPRPRMTAVAPADSAKPAVTDGGVYFQVTMPAPGGRATDWTRPARRTGTATGTPPRGCQAAVQPAVAATDRITRTPWGEVTAAEVGLAAEPPTRRTDAPAAGWPGMGSSRRAPAAAWSAKTANEPSRPA
jgi:hypothetical protein